MSKHHVTATVNGDEVEFLCETQETLLDVLRNTLTLTGAKEGCGSGDCGACSVTVDGRLMCSCLVLGVEAQGKKIETIEGRRAAPLAAQVPRARRLAMRHLYAGLLDRRPVVAGKEQQSDGDRGPLLSGGQPLPLHRL
jgi:succinate dehydrogenase/fumarate reductase-like Fe-S protein